MTARQDTWTSIATPPWVKVLVAGDITTANGLASSTVAGNRLLYTMTSAPYTFAAGTVTLVGFQHGYSIGETFTVALPVAATMTHTTGTATGVSTFTIVPAADTPSTCYFNRKTDALTGGAQHLRALAMATTQAAANTITLWGRHAVSGPSKLQGYGARLTWGASAVRTLELLKRNPADGTTIVLASTTTVTTYKDANESDLNGLQSLALLITDEPLIGTEAGGVTLRGYVNEDNLDGPTLEVTDRGHSGPPPHVGNGTWVLEFGEALVVAMASFEGTDDYLAFAPSQVEVAKHRTRGQIKALLESELSRGVVDNFNDDLLNLRLQDGLDDIEDFFGDAAVWRDRTETMALAEEPETRVVRMPVGVERVYAIYRAIDQCKVGWHMVGIDADDRLLLAIDDVPAEGYVVRYRIARLPWDADTKLCPIPIKWDELVRLAAALRMIDSRRDPEYGVAISERLELRKLSVMSYVRRTYSRMEQQAVDSTGGMPMVPGVVGSPWQRRGPF